MINGFTLGEERIPTYLAKSDYLFTTTLSDEFISFGLNWYKSLAKINEHNNSLIICLNKPGYEILQRLKVPSVLLEVPNYKNENRADWIELEKFYKAAGPVYINQKYKKDIVFSDADIIFFKNPIPKLREEIAQGYDIVVISDKRFDPFVIGRKKGRLVMLNHDKKSTTDYGIQDQVLYGEPNGAFGYFPYGEKVISLFSALTPTSEYARSFPTGIEAGAAQTIFNKRLKELNVKTKVLSVFEFPNGSVWKVPYLKEKIKDTCYIVHYNFCDLSDPLPSRDYKINWMKQDGTWLL
jgi:hypothetical protein